MLFCCPPGANLGEYLTSNYLMRQRVYSLDEARQKIERYCAYQERCHSEVRSKLLSYGLLSSTADQLITELIQTNFLDEERYARAYASGKFRMKKWGRRKIELKLKEKQVHSKCIELGLSEIGESEYLTTLKQLAEVKLYNAKGLSTYNARGKAAQYLYSRGFESDLVWQVIDELLPNT